MSQYVIDTDEKHIKSLKLQNQEVTETCMKLTEQLQSNTQVCKQINDELKRMQQYKKFYESKLLEIRPFYKMVNDLQKNTKDLSIFITRINYLISNATDIDKKYIINILNDIFKKVDIIDDQLKDSDTLFATVLDRPFR